MTTVVQEHPITWERLAAFCQRWQVREFALFGSVLRPDFTDTSDVDVLVAFHDDAHYTMFDLATMADELETMFQRPIDLLDRRAIEASPNYIRRDTILRSARVIYAA
jgi:uncharacterized protein